MILTAPCTAELVRLVSLQYNTFDKQY